MFNKFPVIKFIISFFCLILINCSDYDGSNMGEDQYRFPLKPGSKWLYKNIVTFTDKGNDSTETIIEDWEEEITENVFLENGQETFELKSTIIRDSSTYNSYSYINNSDSGLIEYGNSNASVIIGQRKQKVNFYYIFKGRKFTSLSALGKYIKSLASKEQLRSDSVLINNPATILSYPLNMGKSWKYRPGITAECLSIENISVPAGNFSCWKIKYTNHSSEESTVDDFSWYAYYSENGLIYQEFEPDTVIKTDEYGETIGKGIFTHKIILTDTNLNN